MKQQPLPGHALQPFPRLGQPSCTFWQPGPLALPYGNVKDTIDWSIKIPEQEGNTVKKQGYNLEEHSSMNRMSDRHVLNAVGTPDHPVIAACQTTTLQARGC